MIRPVRKALFWTSAALIVHTHVGYPLALRALAALRGARPGAGSPRAGAGPSPETAELPSVSLIIAAFDEAEVIERKIENALALDYPRDRLEIVVASDGSSDDTVELARKAGADHVLDLPRGGKLAAQNAAVRETAGQVVAFSDANSWWEADALRQLVAALADGGVGYACGEVVFADAGGDNQEGVYWRYEMRVRELESSLAGITAGNGAIYAVPRDSYLFLEPGSSHDLAFPFRMAKRGQRSVYVPEARATERVVPSLEGEWRRKRRMMVGLWDIVIREGMLDPRGYPPLFGFEVFSHRVLRYASPFLHAVLAISTLGLRGCGGVYRLAALSQAALGLAAALADRVPSAPTRLARYYVLVTASIAAGLWDRLRRGSPGTWDKAEGTR
jgi:cellulose synthase/poly-beta-1,6-N-acetylglucosamine synthase-like glycosyltransferase